jgi:hypothetical protein
MTDTTRTALDLDAIRQRHKRRPIAETLSDGSVSWVIGPRDKDEVLALCDEVERLRTLAAAFEVIAAEERKGRWWRDPRNGPNHDHDNPPYWDSTGEVCARCEAWGRALDALDGP